MAFTSPRGSRNTTPSQSSDNIRKTVSSPKLPSSPQAARQPNRSSSLFEIVHTPASLPRIRGWMLRMDGGNLFSKWKKRYFYLEGDKLYWYKSNVHLEHLGFIVLRDVKYVIKRDKAKSPEYEHQIEMKMNNGKSVYLCCAKEEELDEWIVGLQTWKKYLEEDWTAVHMEQSEAEPDLRGDARHMIDDSDGDDKGFGASYVEEVFGSPKQEPDLTTIESENESEEKTDENDKSQDPSDDVSILEPIKLQKKVRQIEKLVKSQSKKIQSLQEKLKDKDSETQEMVASLETKKKHVDMLLKANEEKLQMRQELEQEKRLELQEEIHEKNQKIAELNAKVKQLELELLEKKEIHQQQIAKVKSQDSNKSSKKDKEMIDKLKQKYFFALAINIKLIKSLTSMDTNALFERAIKDNVPVDIWDEWILQHANDKEIQF